MLIVDNDLHLRKLVLTYAQMENYQCREAESGDQALSRQNHPGRPRYDLRRGLPGRIYLLEELYEKIWGLEAMGDNATVAVHINRLREKIEPDPSKPRYIQTVWGAGYRFRGQ